MPKHNPVGMSMSVTLEGFEYQKDLYCKFCLSPQTDFGSEPNPLNLGLKLCLIYLRILWKPVCGKKSNLLIFIVFSKQVARFFTKKISYVAKKRGQRTCVIPLPHLHPPNSLR